MASKDLSTLVSDDATRSYDISKTHISIDKFASLINHSGDVEKVSLSEWNVKNHYAPVVEAVKKAGGSKADVQVFRVAHGSTRCEYYVVTLTEAGVVVGVKARAVES